MYQNFIHVLNEMLGLGTLIKKVQFWVGTRQVSQQKSDLVYRYDIVKIRHGQVSMSNMAHNRWTSFMNVPYLVSNNLRLPLNQFPNKLYINEDYLHQHLNFCQMDPPIQFQVCCQQKKLYSTLPPLADFHQIFFYLSFYELFSSF